MNQVNAIKAAMMTKAMTMMTTKMMLMVMMTTTIMAMMMTMMMMMVMVSVIMIMTTLAMILMTMTRNYRKLSTEIQFKMKSEAPQRKRKIISFSKTALLAHLCL